MKKMNLFGKGLLLLVSFSLSCPILMAQNEVKKSKQTTVTASELKVKYEANGMTLSAAQAQKISNSGARPCVKNTSTQPSAVKRSTFNNLSARTQEFIKNHPEKYTIVD